MTATLVLGAQWGDEGKGKVVDFLAGRARAVVRAQGGSNAGHTVRNDLGEFKLHAIPSGIFRAGVTCVIGPGTAINPDALINEMDELEGRGVSLEGLLVSDRAHLVMPYHLAQERLEEERLGSHRIGTTGRGIGPAYADKHGRFGIRFGDLSDPAWLEQRLGLVLDLKNRLLGAYGHPPFGLEDLLAASRRWAERIGARVCDTTETLDRLLDQGSEVIVEGQLGSMRDVDHGIYPYVTSSSPCAAGLCQGAGIAPSRVGAVLGVVKAYSTCVGAGPMVCELTDAVGERLRQVGHEYGASTGRPRRCGWLDLVALRSAARLNGFTGTVATRLDVLDGFDEIRVCTAYRVGGAGVRHMPTTAAQGEAEPLYETVVGWRRPTGGCRALADLPAEARSYLDRIAEAMDAPLVIVSVGPGRDETIVV